MNSIGTPGDDYSELLARAVSVAETAGLVAAAGTDQARLMVVQQLSALTATLEGLADRLTLIACAYEQGWADADAARGPRHLRAVEA